MKNQRFRIKLTALLLVGLLLLAVGYGARHIPRSGSVSSLRDAILRLTGQATPVPSEEGETSTTLEPTPADSPTPDVFGLGSLSGPPPEASPDQAVSPPGDGSAEAPPSPDPAASPLLTPDGPQTTVTPAPAEGQSLRDALSSLWESADPVPQNP